MDDQQTPIEAVDEALRKVIESAPADPAAVIGASLAHSMLTLMRIPATFLSRQAPDQS